jgi:transcriptional regulator with XRE-family HTH domain
VKADLILGPEHKALTALRLARQLEGLSQAALGARVGRAQCWVSRVENGDILAPKQKRIEMARMLRMPPESLFPEDMDEEGKD